VSAQVTPDPPGRRSPPFQLDNIPAAIPLAEVVRPRRQGRPRWLVVTAVVLLILFVLMGMGPAFAGDMHQSTGVFAAPAAPTLTSVIDGLRNWLIGLLAGVATLFLTIGGIRYITAGGDPMHVERAKTAMKSAAIGYALAALAPLLVAVLRSIVG
jgi:hypothetical protein